MNASQVNQAVAECLGWKKVEGSFIAPKSSIHHKDRNGEVLHWPSPPNFHGSLDAIALAEATLTDEEWISYIDTMKTMLRAHSNSYRSVKLKMHSTAPQRCEAFLRVKGRWEDGV